MNETTLPPSEAGPGHNLPTEAEATFDQLQARTSTLVETANRWANERPEITNEEEAEKAGDFLDQLRKLGTDKTGAIDKARLAEQKPHTDAVDAIRERYRPVKRAVEIAAKLMKAKLTVWLNKKDAEAAEERRRADDVARKAREEAEEAKKRAEDGEGDVIGNTLRAEEAKKRAEDTDRAARRAQAGPKVSSAYGGRSKSLRSHTVVEIEDATKIPAKYLRRLCAAPYVTEALQRAVREDVAAYSQGTEDGGLVSTVPGITIRKEKVAA